VELFYWDLEFELVPVLYAMATGACGTFGQLLYLTALRRGPLTYVSMISSLYPLVATLLAFFILHDPISARQAAGVGLGILSIVILVRANDK
jgi:bacterial/archaeal transporter family protein